MLRRAFPLVAALSLCATPWAQHRPIQADEATKSWALKNATAFLRLAGKNTRILMTQIERNTLERDRAEWYCKLFTSEDGNYCYTLLLDGSSGEVSMFVDYGRVWEQIHHKNRSARPKFATAEQANGALWTLAKKLGLPPNAIMESKETRKEGSKGGDSNSAGSITARFTLRPHGYPFLGAGNRMTLILDPQDGSLVRFVRVSAFSAPPPPERILSQKAATSAALNHAKIAQGKVAAARIGYLDERRLNPRATEFRTRLVWQVEVNGKRVWIDPKSGKVLGEERLKR